MPLVFSDMPEITNLALISVKSEKWLILRTVKTVMYIMIDRNQESSLFSKIC
jgi:hypothetical protein